MAFLQWLQDLRTPLGDAFFSTITYLGEETVFIVLGIVFFWCVSKREGYFLLATGLAGTVLNQFLKLLCRVPRPWVLDESFTIVESARAEAGGYSFPSGHSQMAAGLFGGIARWHKGYLRWIGAALLLLVGFSRLYLGVHTPLDVGVGLLMGVVLALVLYPLMHTAAEKEKTMRVTLAVMVLLSLLYLGFVHLYPFPADVDAENLSHGAKQAYTMLGCLTALWIGFEVERRHVRFDTRAVWWVQVLKVVLGLMLLLGIKEGFKLPLRAIFGTHYVGDGIRYFCMTLFAICVWPLTFRHFARWASREKR